MNTKGLWIICAVLVLSLLPVATPIDASPSTTLLSEDWDAGTIDPTKWTLFGDPAPSLYPGEGIGGSYAVSINAASGSGLFASTALDIAQGVIVEFWQRGWEPDQSIFPSGIDVGLTFCDAGVDHVQCEEWVASIHLSAHDGWVSYTAQTEAGTEQFQEYVTTLFVEYWHKFAIRVGSDGLVSFYVDNEPAFTTSAPVDFGVYDQAWLEIRGEVFLAHYFVDDILVTTLPGDWSTVYLPFVGRNAATTVIPPKLTDENGVAEFHLPEATVRVELQDPVGQPVEGVSVVLLSNGRKVLMLTEDPQQRFLPSFEERDLPQADAAGVSPSSLSSIGIIKVLEIAANFIAVGELVLDFPELVDYSRDYVDICMNVDQMATALTLGGGGILSGLGLAPLALVVHVEGEFALPDILTDQSCAYEWPNPVVVRIYSISGFEGTLMELRGPCPDEPQVDICSVREECFFTGKVTDARDGSALASVHVQVEPGTDYEAWTWLDGVYTMTDVPQGYHTVTASKEQYVSRSELFNLDCGPGTPELDFSLSPVGNSNEYRFKLEWGEYPTDLDSHLWLPIFHPYHIYYADKGRLDEFPYAALDLDDISSYGPETTTMIRTYGGSYMYAVYQFSSSGSLTTSGATVEVYQGEQLLRKVWVPTTGTGRWWLVAYVDGSTGGVSYPNQILDFSPGPY